MEVPASQQEKYQIASEMIGERLITNQTRKHAGESYAFTYWLRAGENYLSF